MRPMVVLGAVTCLSLAGCSRPAETGSSHHDGRYVGVGLYAAGRMWSQMAPANPPKDSAASRLDDDEQVIVVVDTRTGEVRQCGALSGYCVGMNPWTRPLAASQSAPIPLAKHARDLDQMAAAPSPDAPAPPAP